MLLSSPINRLKGVGPVLVKGLNALGINTIGDLLDYYPRRWESYQNIDKLKNIKPGMVCFNAKVERVGIRKSHRNRRLIITEAILTDDTGTVRAIWFNQPYILQSLINGNVYKFRGNYEFKNGYVSLQNPSVDKTSANPASPILPIYSESKQISSTVIRKLVSQCIDLTNGIKDSLPPSILAEHHLLHKSEAIRLLHQANSQEDLEIARRTISFEELSELVLAGMVLKNNISQFMADPIRYDPKTAQGFVDRLGFKLTDAQKKSAHIILQDLDSQTPMNRLLEGDVGSGKTLVALMACTMAVKNGYQAAIMVPTEILARQHFQNSQRLLEAMGIKSSLLISAMKKPDRQKTLDDISTGRANVVIGTHALISKGVEYKNLNLVIVDEQHRFGVNQRKELKSKAGKMPHLLTMTATPIPRSLALVVYGDLDVSVIDELPAGICTH
jgi:ATP-dependent DNA helicase RecG